MKIYIATLPNGFFGSAGQSWRSIDVDKISQRLNEDSQIVSINDLINIEFDKDDIVVYTSSDEENIRVYLRDLMYFVDKKCKILPSYNMLLGHENKGFQELFRRENGFGNVRGNYFFDIDDAYIPMPKVLKTVTGAGSSGVSLVQNKNDLEMIRKKYFNVPFKRKAIKLQRKLKLQDCEFLIYNYRHKGFNRFVEQEFIANLANDFKILVFGDRYYCLKRAVRNNDFRASGSKMFTYVKPSEDILNFARDVFSRLNNPYASLDIAQSEKGCHLIEFQGTNFGPIALLNSSSRYRHSDEGWIEEANDKDLEENFAHAINMFLERQNAKAV